MEMKISTESGRVPITVIHLDGNLDSTTYMTFQAKVEELIQSGTRYLLIDLVHSKFVSSAGFRALHQIFKDLNAIHPDSSPEKEIKAGISDGSYKSPYLKLLNLSEETKVVFTTTGFDMYIEEYDDIRKAVAAF